MHLLFDDVLCRPSANQIDHGIHFGVFSGLAGSNRRARLPGAWSLLEATCRLTGYYTVPSSVNEELLRAPCEAKHHLGASAAYIERSHAPLRMDWTGVMVP